jgi:hypothetical protein
MTTTLTRPFAAALAALSVLGLACLGAGCIEKESRSVIYLEPDGSLTWTVLETDVRSNAEKPADRAQEEADYRRAMLANPTPLVTLFTSLGGRQASRTVLKDTVPFEVHTSATFDRIDVLFERVCAAASISCVASVGDDGARMTLTVEIFGELDVKAPEQEALNDALGSLKFVMVGGHFVGASGFVLAGDRAATLDDESVDGEPVTITLTWVRDDR